MAKATLTKRQVDILQWIDRTPHNHSNRAIDNSLVLGGDSGSIRIAWEDNQALLKMIEPNPSPGCFRQKHFTLTKAGRAALSQASRGQTEEG